MAAGANTHLLAAESSLGCTFRHMLPPLLAAWTPHLCASDDASAR